MHGVGYERWSINFFVAWGHEFIAARPVPADDEQHFSANYPSQIRKRMSSSAFPPKYSPPSAFSGHFAF